MEKQKISEAEMNFVNQNWREIRATVYQLLRSEPITTKNTEVLRIAKEISEHRSTAEIAEKSTWRAKIY